LEIWQRVIEETVDRALAEDLGWGDVTTDILIPPNLVGKASVLIKASGVLAGTKLVETVFHRVDPSLRVEILIPDGKRVQPGDVAANIEGVVSSILKAERVSLNFLQRLSGIASETARYVEAVAGLPVRIVDTRKTTPGLRLLEKYAIKVGGGYNHRQHLGDAILIKDNHLAVLRSQGMGLKEVITTAKRRAPHHLRVEVEVKTVEEAMEATDASADVVMLDNMSLEEMCYVVKLLKGRSLFEASGGVTLSDVRAIAGTGVDLISVGALTHSATALDISLEIEP
jgi:nicotinate-nucleotide pyrophosphorylase (carboxylating)